MTGLSERQVTVLAIGMIVAAALVAGGSLRFAFLLGRSDARDMIHAQRHVIDSLAVRAARADTLEAQLGVLICVSPGTPPQVHRC